MFLCGSHLGLVATRTSRMSCTVGDRCSSSKLCILLSNSLSYQISNKTLLKYVYILFIIKEGSLLESLGKLMFNLVMTR